MAKDILAFADSYTVDTDDVEIVLGEYMRDHTSFRIGGSADAFCTPTTEEALMIGLEKCRQEELPWWIIGNGTNVLVGDRGIRGVVFSLCGLNEIRVEDDCIVVGAGAALTAVAREALKAGLTGMEFASGIPGSLGGALYMNAGAFGGTMDMVTEEVRVLTPYGAVLTLRGDEMNFGYRQSRLEQSGEIVLSAKLKLQKGDKTAIEEKMKELTEKRNSHQPMELPSAGSTFKRPEGNFAGKLIQDAGLAGYTVGKAQVSPKHCGFVVNLGGASAKDVQTLCDDVIRKVKETSGVTLEMEVLKIGEF